MHEAERVSAETAMLELKGLGVSYGGVAAVRDLSLEGGAR